LPEALARSHNDSVLSRPARKSRGRDKPSLIAAILRRLASRPMRTVAGATMAAAMTGIVINALVLQKSHRLRLPPAPVASAPVEKPTPPALAPAPAPAPTPTPAATPPATPSASADAEGAAARPAPPARPGDLGALIESTAPPHSGDPIRDLLRSEGGVKDGEARKLTLSAQNALAKLGYPIKANGVFGPSTQQALRDFERTHNLTPSGEISAKLVRQLNAAANASAH
jgi:hypothetical protein